MHTPYNWVDTEAQLEHLARLLGEDKAFAVDTEQHSVRSFLGYTAPMQISTQNEDYLIDTIALHGVMGFLRPLFANPSICKGTTELPGFSFRLPEFQSDPFKALAVTASTHHMSFHDCNIIPLVP
ncbi:unnamed protein product [Urochloa humidicola]